MRKEPFAAQGRPLLTKNLDADLVVVGGGLAGTCCAITAARAGIKVVLVQDRPVLGGNGSSEVRLWTLGATAHMSNNNRWAREGGVIDEIIVENLWRNREGNALIFDTILLEKVVGEPNLTLLLNTAAFAVEKSGPDTIALVRAFCSQNSTLYEIGAPLFCDASGDGVLGFLSGAAFRMGAESTSEFGEKFAPSEEYGELLGHSIYFYSKDVGKPVRFVPPSYALDDITKIPRFRSFDAQTYGCRLWWIEYGGRLDTVHETEAIKWELWKVVYGVWDYIKNSGKFPEADTLTLEWVGTIPGKRESRRFEGEYLLRQQDLIEQTHFADAVAFGGWSIDLHPADGVFSEKPGCNQWHSKGLYQIPYRSLYSRNVSNLFLAGRIISATHVAFGSTRVMATGAHGAQAVALAAAQCVRHKVKPAAIAEQGNIALLQRDLLRRGQHIPGYRLSDEDDLAQHATITATSHLTLAELPADGPLVPLDKSRGQMLPLAAGKVPTVTFMADVSAPTVLKMELRISSRPDNHTPDVVVAEKVVDVSPGLKQKIVFDMGDVSVDAACYGFFCVCKNEHVGLCASEQRVTGVLSVSERRAQAPASDIGVETFPLWCPERRPGGHNFALTIVPWIDLFAPTNVSNGVQRPTSGPNAWVADTTDGLPALTLAWNEPQAIGRVELAFDTDFDHPMESCLYGHPEHAMPFCVRHFRVKDGAGNVLADVTNNHQTLSTILLAAPVTTDRLVIECPAVHGAAVPAALFEVRCYAK